MSAHADVAGVCTQVVDATCAPLGEGPFDFLGLSGTLFNCVGGEQVREFTNTFMEVVD